MYNNCNTSFCSIYNFLIIANSVYVRYVCLEVEDFSFKRYYLIMQYKYAILMIITHAVFSFILLKYNDVYVCISSKI